VKLVLVLLVLLLASQPAFAQPAMTPSTQPPVELSKPRHHKSEVLAGGLSFGLTAAGLTTLLITNSLATPDDYGRRLRPQYKAPLYLTSAVLLAVGPTTGHIYAGHFWNRGLAVRLVSGTVMVLAAGAIDNCCSEGDHNGNGTAAGVTIAAGIVYLGASLYECATASRAVRRYNERQSPTFAIAPMISREPGIAVVGRF
jgi:hypothetical protein